MRQTEEYYRQLGIPEEKIKEMAEKRIKSLGEEGRLYSTTKGADVAEYLDWHAQTQP